MEMLAATAADDSSGANPSSVKSDDSSPRHDSGRGSPPPNCAICLGTCRNKSFTDSCLHQFCFKCLLTWSKVKAECPLCKQNFKSIIHNVRSNQQYDEYTVEQRVEETVQSIDIDNFTNATRRFRYRTTLTLPRRESIAIQQLLMHYPMMADVFPPPAPHPAPRPPRRRSPASFRRTVYRHNLWARPLPDFTGRFRDCSPEFYRYNDSQMHRLVPWLNRELHYLLNENIGHISYVMTRILELLPQHHINSPEFREAIQRYFGDRTEHFLHELYCFASTPYDMTGYDRYVQYTTDSRISTMVNEVISSSDSDGSGDSDIVMISHSEPAEPPAGPSRPPDTVIPIETISQSDSEDSSDEVMVVGYIKPPQDRTPEVVDLLGSDSDVVVHEPVPTPAPTSVPTPAPVVAPLVKLSLKRHAARSSSSDSSWSRTPPRRRRRRSHSSTTSDSCLSTPSRGWSATPPPLPPRSPTSSSSFSTRSSSLVTDTDLGSSSSDRRRLTKRKARRKTKSAERRRRSTKRTKQSRERRESRDRRSAKKSHSGKGVKSSKRSAPSEPEPPLTPPLPIERPGPSHAPTPPPISPRRRRRTANDTKRLRSVVNVMYKSETGPASSNSTSEPSSLTVEKVEPMLESPSTAVKVDKVEAATDSEDDLPLNLSLQKTFFTL